MAFNPERKTRAPARSKDPERFKPHRAHVAGIEVEQVHVPYPTSNSGVALKAPVTLPKAPWEREDQ